MSLYGQILPLATYSPWNEDSSFQSVFDSIQEFTLVDKYRCYELCKLIGQVAKLHEGNLIEIGVWRGGTGVLIAQEAMNYGIKDKVYLCDTFKGTVKAGKNDSVYKNGKHSNTSKEIVENLINRMDLNNIEILEGVFPEDTGSKVEKLKFRFVHIDVDVYQSAKDIINWIWDKIVPCGIIVYDDYGSRFCDGITKYVNEQINCKDRIIIHNLNGHAVVVKLNI